MDEMHNFKGGTTLYPVLWSSSLVKAKVKSQGRILVGQRSSIDFCTVHTTIDTFTDSCVNVIKKILEIVWTSLRVKNDF